MDQNKIWIPIVVVLLVVSYVFRHQVRSLIRQITHPESTQHVEDRRSGNSPLAHETIESAVKQEYEAALRQLKARDKVGAEETIHAAVKEAGSKYGTDSPSYARALSKESSILARIGDLKRAADDCRTAAAIEPITFQDKKDRLTYLMNLGEFLTHLGEFDQAEKVLRGSLEQRKNMYGVNHPGYAYGLEALADLLLNRGDAQESLKLLDQAIAIYRPIDHQELPFNLALRAFAMKAAEGAAADPFPDWSNLAPDLQQKIVRWCLRFADLEAPKHSLLVLQDLKRRLEDSPGVGAQKLLDMTIAVANTARMTGNIKLYAESYQEVVRLCSELGDRQRLISAYQALAMALTETGDAKESEKAYQAASDEARQVGDKKLVAGVLRNYAIWQDEQGHRETAAKLHPEAVENAEASGDKVMQGRTLCAYGIFLQHHGDLANAKPLLDKALKFLPASDRDAFYAQAHRDALGRKEKCGCGTDQTLSALIQRLVEEGAPEGLLKSVSVKMNKGEAQVEVATNRRPTQAEAERLNSVVNLAIVDMKREYRRAGNVR